MRWRPRSTLRKNEWVEMRSRDIVLCLFVGLFAAAPLMGQPVTADGPAGALDLITLTRDTPFDQALRVIQTFSSRALVDPQHLTAPIGVDIDRQPWRQALERIAAQNGLQGMVQADRAALREFGVDWSTLSGGRVDVSASHLGADLVTRDQFSVGARANLSRSVSVDMLLRTFESKSVGEVVANPQVKVRGGQTGYIQVGSDFSVITSDFAGNAIAQFHSTGTILTVTPIIRSQDGIDFVDLSVQAERSSLVDPVRNLINKTVARTSTLLKDGEQTAIGGLYGQEMTRFRSGVPLFKDLPGWFFGLRYLFGHDSRRVAKTELVVLLHVNIVPSVRQRVEQRLQDRGAFEIIRERRKAFEEMMKDYDPGTSEADSL